MVLMAACVFVLGAALLKTTSHRNLLSPGIDLSAAWGSDLSSVVAAMNLPGTRVGVRDVVVGYVSEMELTN